jgi:transcriptional regulator with XRE-family HTH domain
MTTTLEHDRAAQTYDHFLGEVRAEIARRRIRQTSLATRMGMHQQHLSARLSGHTPFKFVELIRLAEALDIPLAKLVSFADDSPGWFRSNRAKPHRPPHHGALFPPGSPVRVTLLRPTG